MDFRVIFLLFWVYSTLGWFMEVVSVSIRSKKIVNRGFFLGPYCPIYGTGGILLLSLNNYKNEPMIIFILAIVICSIVEYLTSYVMELIYKVRWWDYSDRLFNVNGRICLFNSICFGVLGMLMVCYLNPFFISVINDLNNNLLTFLSCLIFIITITDIILTFTTMFDIRKTITDLKEKTLTSLFRPNLDQTEEISKKVRTILKEKGFIQKHLSRAYSNLKVYKNNFFKRNDEVKKYVKREKLENSYIIGFVISILIGLILGKVFNNISIFIILSFTITILIIRIINRRNDERGTIKKRKK